MLLWQFMEMMPNIYVIKRLKLSSTLLPYILQDVDFQSSLFCVHLMNYLTVISPSTNFTISLYISLLIFLFPCYPQLSKKINKKHFEKIEWPNLTAPHFLLFYYFLFQLSFFLLLSRRHTEIYNSCKISSIEELIFCLVQQ